MDGDIIAKMMLDISDVQVKSNRAKKSIDNMLQKIQSAWTNTNKKLHDKAEALGVKQEKEAKKIQQAHARAARGVSKSWWDSFGRVAVGFTVAYRAMNAFENGMRLLLDSFVLGLKEIDAFNQGILTVAGSLLMMEDKPSKQAFQTYLDFGEHTFKKLEVLAVQHFATGTDLQNAYMKMVVHGIVPATEEQLRLMALLVDRISMETVGADKTRQILTEIDAVLEGQCRSGAKIARNMNIQVENYKDLIKEMKKTPDILKKNEIAFGIIDEYLGGFGFVTEEVMKTMAAWVDSSKTAASIIVRAGLDTMYEDVVGYMREIVGSLMDQNGLTEEGLEVGYLYHASWESVKDVMTDLRDVSFEISAAYKSLTFDLPLITNTIWSMSLGIKTIKFGLESVLIILETLWDGFKPPTEDVEAYITNLAEEMGKLETIGEKLGYIMALPVTTMVKPLKKLATSLRELATEYDPKKWTPEKVTIKIKPQLDAGNIEEETESLLETMAKKLEEHNNKFLDEMSELKMPDEMFKFDAAKFEEYRKKMLAAHKMSQKEISDMLAKLRQKGGNKALEEDEKRLKKLNTLVMSLQKDAITDQYQQKKQSIDAEFQARMLKIQTLTDAESAHNQAAWSFYTDMLKTNLQSREDLELLAAKIRRQKLKALDDSAYEATGKENKRLLDKMGFYSSDHYEKKKVLIEEDAAAMIAAGASIVDVQAWSYNQLKDLSIAHNQHILETSDSLIEATGAAWENYILQSETWIQQIADTGTEIMDTFAQGVGDAFAQALIYGEDLTKSLQSLAQSIAATIISTLIEVTIEKAIQWALSKVIDATTATTKLAILAAETYAGAFASSCALGAVGVAAAPVSAAAAVASMLAGATAARASGAALGASLASFDKGGISTVPGVYYAGVPEAHIPLQDNKSVAVELNDVSPKIQIDIANVSDPILFDQYLASSRGRDAIVNVIGAESQTIRRVIR